MSVEVGISPQTMTSRINYNAPLKSVRTVRAAKFDQHDITVPNSGDGQAGNGEQGKSSDADLDIIGIPFVWENSPGQSKAEQEKTAPLELKPPPVPIPPPPSSKSTSVDIGKSPPSGTTPVPAHNGKYDSVAGSDDQLPPPAGTPAPNTRSNPFSNHHLPPKPSSSNRTPSGGVIVPYQSSADKPPSRPRKAASGMVHQSGHGNGGYVHRSGHNTQTGGQETRDRQQHSTLGNTLHAVTSQSDVRGAPHSSLNRGSHHYLAERLRQAPAQGGKDFYFSGRHASAGTVLNTAQASQFNSCMPTRPNSCSASEVGSHSDVEWDGDQTESADVFSNINMNTMDQNARCQISVLDGGSDDPHDKSRHTDPRARDFIMERFLPAAKAMVTESDASERRSISSHHTPSVSPTRGKGRLPGRSRFAFKDQFAGENEEHEVDQSDMLFKCKFPWQMGALRAAGTGPQSSVGPFDPRNVEQLPSSSFGYKKEQSPSTSFVSREHSPSASFGTRDSPSASFGTRESPLASFGNRKHASSPGRYHDDHGDPAWAYTESEGSATPKSEMKRTSERRPTPTSRHRNTASSSFGQHSRSGEFDHYDSSRALSFSGESANDEFYEGEFSMRSNEASSRGGFLGVPKDRLHETATHEDFNNGESTPPRKGSDFYGGGNNDAAAARRAPEMNGNNGHGPISKRANDVVFSSNLGTLLRTTNKQSKDLGKSAHAALQAAVANVPESIPPSSILNHHRHKQTLTTAVAHSSQPEDMSSYPPAAHSSGYGGTNAMAKPSYHNNVHDESNYPKHLTLNLVRQQATEPCGASGRSLESLNDEVWEASGRESTGSKSPTPENYDRKSLVLQSSNLSVSESINEDIGAVGWPLAKAYNNGNGYARTPSSDSKDASFSSFSDRSLRSPSNHGSSIQPEKVSEKYSPVSVLQPPLPKSPAESWLFKLRAPAPPSSGSSWQGANPKKLLDYNTSTDEFIDVKWAEKVQLRDKLAQEQKMGPGN